MNAIHRAWHVYADPAESTAARDLKLFIPLGITTHVLGLVLPAYALLAARPFEIVLLYAVLWVVRQRDEARARAAEPARQP